MDGRTGEIGKVYGDVSIVSREEVARTYTAAPTGDPLAPRGVTRGAVAPPAYAAYILFLNLKDRSFL